MKTKKEYELISILKETQRLLKNGASGAINDTVWSDTHENTTLYELIEIAVNEGYQSNQG